MNKKELWLSLARYNFDHLAPAHLWDLIAAKFGGENPFTKAFADKLSRKLKWKHKFATKAIWEYKKFVYLGVISDSGVTPSKIIDQVWHEHLLFSAGYRKFCEEVIKFDFTHNPELIPIETQTKTFQAQYFQTLSLYEKEFGSAPPADIWDNTKFNKAQIKKRPQATLYESYSSFNTTADSAPLISMFPSAENSSFEFGGGDFGGGGASGSWDDGSSNSSDSGSGSDSGGSSDGGSSCSSSCGGGGGGD